MDAQTDSSDVYLKTLAWLHARQKPLLIGLIVVAVIGAVWGFWVWEKGQNEADANAELFNVPVDNGMRPADTAKKLLDVANGNSGSVAGEYAQLLAAGSLFGAGNYPEAQKQFTDFIDNHAESTLVPQAKLGVAACLEAEGKIPEAISQYHDLVVTYPSDMNIVSPAKLTLARLYDQENKPEQAFNFYAELARMLVQNPYDPWGSEARERASLLLAKHPELLKSQNEAGAAANGSSTGFSLSGSGNPSENQPATPPSQPSKPASPSGSQTPNLLKFPNVSSNSTGKP
jgi:predicted negative regulator of RcsB-dependent stress response